MVGSLDHIGIAVAKLDEALELYVQGLGMELKETEDVPGEKVRVAMLQAGETRVELLEPTDSSSPIDRFLQQGKKGVHHLAFRVEDIQKALKDYRAKGVQVLEPAPREGAGGCQVAFIHPKSASGVLIELVQRPK